MQGAGLTPDHAWLAQLAGEWVADGEGLQARETARCLEGRWLVIEGEGPAEEGTHRYVFTIGFDDAKGRYVGSFVSSMMSSLWVYEGWREGDTLTLESLGPRFDGEPGTAIYRDTITLDGASRTLVSTVETPDGGWHEFMRATSTRVG